MSVLRLNRFCNGNYFTFGTMRVLTHKFYTVELPWKDNAPFISCVPEGVWKLHRDRYDRGEYDTLRVEVPGRNNILFHIANVAKDVQGCIGVGLGLWTFNDDWGVKESRVGFNRFMSLLNSGPLPDYLWITSGHERDNDG